jgi:hypothetical protein
VSRKQKRKRKRRNNPGGFSPASATKLTIEEVDRLFQIFKQTGAGAKDNMDKIKAIALVSRRLEELQAVRALNHKSPKFKVWRDETLSVLKRVLPPDSPNLIRFENLGFAGPPVLQTDMWGAGPRLPNSYISPEDAAQYQESCETAERSLQAAIREIEDFGVYVEPGADVRTGSVRGGGVHQTFHGPVTIENQAIATDNAIQKIGHMGKDGVSLKEIANLFRESMELNGRQIQEGLAGIEVLASEVEKPEKDRNWKSILDSGGKVLDIAGKATDLAAKLAPYTPHILTLVDKAKHFLG